MDQVAGARTMTAPALPYPEQDEARLREDACCAAVERMRHLLLSHAVASRIYGGNQPNAALMKRVLDTRDAADDAYNEALAIIRAALRGEPVITEEAR